jgi:hypothetical protein
MRENHEQIAIHGSVCGSTGDKAERCDRNR